MSSALDMSLDDLIVKSKSTGASKSVGTGSYRGSRRGGGGPSYGFGPARRFTNRAPARASPYSSPVPVPVDGQVWQGQALAMNPYGGTGGKLYISNLDYGVSIEDIKVLFSEVGTLKQYGIHYDKSGRPKGTAEVEYIRRSDAVAAIKRYNNVLLDGKDMRIELVGVNIVAAPVMPPISNVIPGNPKAAFRGMQERVNRRVATNGNSYRGIGRGRGQGRNQVEKKTAEDLDVELEKYHFEAMHI